jgi:hypothetical protein
MGKYPFHPKLNLQMEEMARQTEIVKVDYWNLVSAESNTDLRTALEGWNLCGPVSWRLYGIIWQGRPSTGAVKGFKYPNTPPCVSDLF